MTRARTSPGRRWWRVVPIIAGIAVASSMLLGGPAAADPIEEQHERVAQLADELERLAEATDILAEDHVTAIDEQRRLDADVGTAAAQVVAAEGEVTALREELAAVAVHTFMGAGADGLGSMLDDSRAHTQRLQRDQLARVALSTGDATVDELDLALEDLDERRVALDQLRSKAAGAAAEVEAAQEASDAQRSELEQARAAAESELGRLIEEEAERRARASAERVRRAAEAADSAAGNSEGAAGDGTDAGGRSGVPPASARAGIAVDAAMSQLGVPYRYAMSTPGVGFDCSGLTAWAWQQAGVDLPHQSGAQHASIPHVAIQDARPGDLIFYYSPISHVGMYIGGGQMVNAPNSTTVVKVATVNWEKVTGVGRPG